MKRYVRVGWAMAGEWTGKEKNRRGVPRFERGENWSDLGSIATLGLTQIPALLGTRSPEFGRNDSFAMIDRDLETLDEKRGVDSLECETRR